MSYNRTLVIGASAAMGLAGDAAPKVFSYLSFQCQQAIGIAAADDVITKACGPGFSDMNLLLIILVGVGAFVVIHFGRDLLQSAAERDKSKPAY